MKKIYMLLLLIFLSLHFPAQNIYVNWLTASDVNSRPFPNTYYIGDKLPTNSWYNFEINYNDNWSLSEVGIGKEGNFPLSNTTWYTAAKYGANGNNSLLHADLGNYQFTSSGKYYVAGQARGNSGDYLVYENGPWQNGSASASGVPNGNTAFYNVQELGIPSNFSATCDSNNAINLSWDKWNGRDVIILRNTTNNFVDPSQNYIYYTGNQIGDSKVLYRGNATSYNDTDVIPGTTYYYKIYSENYSYYSTGTATLTKTLGKLILTSAIGTDDQTILNSTPLTNIKYTFVGSSNPTVTNLPPGILPTFNGNMLSISGTPTQSGLYNYTVSLPTECGNISVVGKIKVNSNIVEFANIQLPKQNSVLLTSKPFDVYSQVKLLGVTDQPTTTQNGINVWIGYSTVDATASTDFASSNWTWIKADINPGYNNTLPFYNPDIDEYVVKDLMAKAAAAGKPFVLGTEYYIVSRAQKEGAIDFAYGGIDGTTNNVSGGLWSPPTYFSLKVKTNDQIVWDGSKWQYWDEYQNKYILNVSDFPVIPVSPDLLLKTEIQGDYPASAAGFETSKLIVDNGKTITIGNGKTLKITNDIVNNNAGNEGLIIQSDANLIQVNEADSNSGGGATIYRNSAVPNNQYSFWSSPISNQDLYGFYDGNAVPANRVMTYNTWNDFYSVVPSGNFVKGTGYSVKGPASGLSNAKFAGTLYNGSFTYPLAMTGQKYNLIGNPYASNLDLALLYQQNSSNIDSMIYFWDFHNNTVLQQYGGVYSATYTKHNFAIYNAASDTMNKAPNGTLTPTGKVSVGQGFIVQAVKNSIDFKNAQRSGSAAVFFGKGASASADRYWLKLTTPANLFTTMAIVYMDKAEDKFDVYDSKIVAETSDNLYSFAGTEKVAINGRATFSILDRINLGVSHFIDGVYKVSIDNKEGVFSNGQSIYLKDNITGIVTNLAEGDYSYSTVSGTFNNRFEIIYQPETVLSTGINAKQNVTFYKDGIDFIIHSIEKNIVEMELYDAAGRLVMKTNCNAKEVRFSSAPLLQGMYLIKARLQDGEEVVIKIRK